MFFCCAATTRGLSVPSAWDSHGFSTKRLMSPGTPQGLAVQPGQGDGCAWGPHPAPASGRTDGDSLSQGGQQAGSEPILPLPAPVCNMGYPRGSQQLGPVLLGSQLAMSQPTRPPTGRPASQDCICHVPTSHPPPGSSGPPEGPRAPGSPRLRPHHLLQQQEPW